MMEDDGTCITISLDREKHDWLGDVLMLPLAITQLRSYTRRVVKLGSPTPHLNPETNRRGAGSDINGNA